MNLRVGFLNPREGYDVMKRKGRPLSNDVSLQYGFAHDRARNVLHGYCVDSDRAHRSGISLQTPKDTVPADNWFSSFWKLALNRNRNSNHVVHTSDRPVCHRGVVRIWSKRFLA